LLLAAGLKERGMESVIGCRPDGALGRAAAEMEVPTLRLPANNLAAALVLGREARRFDLLHCHTGRAHSLAALTGWWHGRPFILTRRVDFLPGNNFYNRFKFRRAARVVCISRFIAGQLENWGVPRERLEVIWSSVPPPDPALLTEEHRRDVRRRLGVAEEATVVGNIAAMVGHKDHATLLRAARRVIERRPEVRFVVIGDGKLRRPLEQLRRELGMESHVLFAGFLPRAERFLPGFDVFALSSRMEGLGSIVLDAFAAGVPVAATAGGAIPELVRNETTGLLAPVGDETALAGAILRLLEDRELAGRVIEGGRTIAREEATVERMVEAYLKIYERVCLGSGR
jgi:glycosyltransferase involved in cell wall biosynthesis